MIAILVISVIWSGFNYQFDGDELLHAQKAFLIGRGYVPFRDYFSIYTPVYHWLAAPTILFFGTTFRTLRVLRIEMIFAYAAELIFSMLCIRILFDWRVAMVFLGLIALDPFSTFAGMQIRPDTLMMLLFSVGLFASSIAIVRNRRFDWAIAGMILGGSVLTAVKIVPAAVPVISILAYGLFIRNDRRSAVFFLGGAILPLVVFAGYFIGIGLSKPMILQLVVDVIYLSNSIQNPMKFGYFYSPDNVFIFGHPGTPSTWWYTHILPIAACAGVFFQIMRISKANHVKSMKDRLILSLTIGMVCTFVGLFIPTTVFIQYYLPLTWFFSIFAAVALITVWDSIVYPYRITVLIGATIIFLCFFVSAVSGNLRRATIGTTELEHQLDFRWKQIPEGSYVFPNYIFRPIAYPLGVYQIADMPETVRGQFIKPEIALEKSKVQFILLNEPGLASFDWSTQVYIREHYERDASDEHFMTRRSVY